MRNVSLRSRLLLLSLVGFLPLAAMSGIGLLELVMQQHKQVERSSRELSRALATAVDAALGESVSVLQTLATSSALDGGDLGRFQQRAERVMEMEPNWIMINLSEPSGAVVLNTRSPRDAFAQFNRDTESFNKVKATLKPAIGDLARGAGLEWGIPVRVPVIRNGRLRFVLSGIVKPNAILEVVNRQRVPPDWVVSVFDAKGIRVARSRLHDQFIGSPPAPELRDMMTSGPDEEYGLTKALEGDSVYTAFSRSQQTSWTVAIGIGSAAFDAGVLKSLAVFGGGMLLSLIVGGVAAVRITRSINRPIRELARASRVTGRKDPLAAPATKIREIADLSSALIASDAAVMAAREQAETASRAKDEFLAMLGHELRNPLAPIVTALRLMEMRRDEVNVAERRIIERQVAHLSRLVDDLLDISRITRGKIELELKRVHLASAVSGALEMLQPMLEKRVRPIDLDLPEDPIYVKGDATRLTQVLSNLLANAMRHTPSDARIALRLRRSQGMAEILVEDAGSGIAPDLLPRLFDVFVQGRQKMDRRAGGLGLGLAIVKALVELHGGTVSAASGGENQGSTFVVRLPLAEADALSNTGPAQTQLSAPAGRGGRVLVVDDNFDAAETLALLLRSAGYDVRTAGDAESALASMETFPPALAVLDIGLPGMDGYELAIQMRTRLRNPSLKLIALTGYGRDSDLKRAMESGFDVHLVKPANPEHLLDEVARLLSTDRRQRIEERLPERRQG